VFSDENVANAYVPLVMTPFFGGRSWAAEHRDMLLHGRHHIHKAYYSRSGTNQSKGRECEF
jgi:hypothetical protein